MVAGRLRERKKFTVLTGIVQSREIDPSTDLPRSETRLLLPPIFSIRGNACDLACVDFRGPRV